MVYCNSRQCTSHKVCRFTVAESGIASAKMAAGDTSGKLQITIGKFQNNAINDVKQISSISGTAIVRLRVSFRFIMLRWLSCRQFSFTLNKEYVLLIV